MRLDKFLKVSRLIKRRTVANEACDNARVTVNGRPAKASYDVKPGDVLRIALRPADACPWRCWPWLTPCARTTRPPCTASCRNNSARTGQAAEFLLSLYIISFIER